MNSADGVLKILRCEYGFEYCAVTCGHTIIRVQQGKVKGECLWITVIAKIGLANEQLAIASVFDANWLDAGFGCPKVTKVYNSWSDEDIAISLIGETVDNDCFLKLTGSR